MKSLQQEQGQQLVEFALTLLIVLTILMFAVDFGRAVYGYSVISQAAQEAARFGIVRPYDEAGIVQTARQWAIALDPALIGVSVSWPDAATVEVQVTYQFYPVVPLVNQFLDGQPFLLLSNTARMSLN